MFHDVWEGFSNYFPLPLKFEVLFHKVNISIVNLEDIKSTKSTFYWRRKQQTTGFYICNVFSRSDGCPVVPVSATLPEN